jgi:hypothetical protein
LFFITEKGEFAQFSKYAQLHRIKHIVLTFTNQNALSRAGWKCVVGRSLEILAVEHMFLKGARSTEE